MKRGEYHIEACSFPIAFYKKENQTFLIHGTDWNRLDITCLETDELLTDRTVDYENDSGYFDYFHSSLLVSPDAKHFTSNGWHWHPYGQIYCFSIEKFLTDFELSHQEINVTDEAYYDLDWHRPMCWIDEKTVAVGFNQKVCDEQQRTFPNEILFINIRKNKIVRKIEFPHFGLNSEGNVFGELFFANKYLKFISLNKKTGLVITDIDGKEIYSDENLKEYRYSGRHRIFYKFEYDKSSVMLNYCNLAHII